MPEIQSDWALILPLILILKFVCVILYKIKIQKIIYSSVPVEGKLS